MSFQKKPIYLRIQAPHRGSALPGELVGPYGAALLREVASCAGEADGAPVERIDFVDAGPANLTLATWCALVDQLELSFPGAKVARMRFDLPPEDVNEKTAEYAMRFRSLMDMDMGVLSPEGHLPGEGLASLAGAIAHMERAKLPSYGVTLRVTGATDAKVALEQLEPYALGFIRLLDVEGRPFGIQVPGYTHVGPDGIHARLPRYAAWFSDLGADDRYAFGVGAVSVLGGETIRTTSDLALYIREAGCSPVIYG